MNLDLEKPFQETHPIVFRMSAQVVRIDEGLKPSNLYQLTLRKEFLCIVRVLTTPAKTTKTIPPHKLLLLSHSWDPKWFFNKKLNKNES